MKKSFTRRSFLKTNLQAGLASVAGTFFLPEIIKNIVPGGKRTEQKKKNRIWSVKKELYVPSPEQRAGVTVNMFYTGKGLKREEIRSIIKTSDLVEKPLRRVSTDNGYKWSEWETIDEKAKIQDNCTLIGGAEEGGQVFYDPVSGHLFKPVFQRIIKGDPKVAYSEIWKGNRLFCDHGFYKISKDDGSTWSEPHLLKYEDGPDFNPENWAEEKYYRTNEMYIGGATVLSNGTIAISATIPVPFIDEEDTHAPSIFPNNYREGCVGGAICFIGKWNEITGDYHWTISNRVYLPRRISSRGLDELDLCQLSNGKLLMNMRGSNTGLDPIKCPGRRWYSVSTDGGLTWSEVKDMRYDTDEQFYSPASIASTIRSSQNGKIYWIGNISENPPDGNSPRYPLQIVEIEQDKICFKKETVTIIDDRDPAHDSESLQLSNFSMLENRETNEIEIYLTRLGERGGGTDIWTADAYKYTIGISNER